VFHGLLGKFVPGQVILFAVMHGRRTVRMRRQFVKLRGSLMEILRHGISSLNIPISGASAFRPRG
jgi:hypothetical protein